MTLLGVTNGRLPGNASGGYAEGGISSRRTGGHVKSSTKIERRREIGAGFAV